METAKLNTTKENPINIVKNSEGFENPNSDLNKEYTDVRSVTISPVTNYSAYRRANRAALGVRKYIIGSSVNSCRILSSNKDEIETYFPALVGLSPNNPDFIGKVKAYLCNIQFNVSEAGSTLDVSFVYNKKSDYLSVKAKEDKINETFDNVNRADISAVLNACKKYVTDLNALESTKCKLGHPVKITDYLMYRHCLLYKDVAKDIALINSDSSYRFYIKNEAREAEKQKKLVNARKIAMKNFIELNADDAKRAAVYIEMVASNNGNIGDAILKSKDEQESAIMDFVNTNPDKFNKLVSDKTIKVKAFIEQLIARGELVRAEYNQQISTPDGMFIGSNVNDAVAYFENPKNTEVRTMFENKLKLF